MNITQPGGHGSSDGRIGAGRADDDEKLELLLEMFLRADGDKWTLREIQEATGEVVSASYLSSIRARRIRKVGGRMRRAMARVMNFPPELWDAEPEEWSRVLAEKPPASERGQAPSRVLSGTKRLRALHTKLLDLPDAERDEIGTVLENLVDKAERELRG